MKRIETLIKDGDFAAATKALKDLCLKETDPDEMAGYCKLVARIPVVQWKQHGLVSKRIALLGGYTTQFIAPLLQISLLCKGIHVEIHQGEYGELESLIHSKDEKLAEFRPDISYFLVGSDHLHRLFLAEEVAHWKDLWERYHSSFGGSILINTFEESLLSSLGNFELKSETGRLRFLKELNLSLGLLAPHYVHLCDIAALASEHGYRNWRDDKLYDLAKFPIAQKHWFDYADNAASVISAIIGKTRKCIVLDLDNTLWSGVVGDDGISGIEVGTESAAGEAFQRFQQYLKSLKHRGILLAVCSKNDLANAREPFEKRPEMILKLDDFAAFVANWEPKPENLTHIAKELNLGLNALVFVDDNPVERDIVRKFLPEVAVVELPEDPAEYAATLSRSRLFETIAITDEDKTRTDQYRANSERTRAASEISDYPAYLSSLEMKAVVAPLDMFHLPRVTQLINKTNQFNLTTHRYTESEVKAMMLSSEVVALYVKLKDKFGDNGLISVFIAKAQSADSYLIDTWLMSCRVLKREVENLVFREACRALTERGISRLVGEYLPSPKNQLVKNLFPDLGFHLLKEIPDGASQWVYDLRKVSELPLRPSIKVVAAENY